VYFLVQASSVSWSGGPDLCMNVVDGQPVVYWTVARIFENFPEAEVVIIAPGFDREGELNALKELFPSSHFRIYYGHNDSPLLRMIEATDSLAQSDYTVRIDGLHMWFDVDAVRDMLSSAYLKSLDCIKFPDNFPVQFAAEVYRVDSLRRAHTMLSEVTDHETGKFHIHPRFFIMHSDAFNTEYLSKLPSYSDAYLMECRARAVQIYREPRLDVNQSSIKAGDQLSYHYELALSFLTQKDTVLDVASGIGYGGHLVAPNVATVTCADFDELTLAIGEERFGGLSNLTFSQQDVTAMTFADHSFDAVLSMETVEHIEDDQAYFQEIARVLRPGGYLILSTPQNAQGRIPINPEHVREYSLEELCDRLEEYFDIRDAFGLKAGTIHYDGDHLGSNTFLVAASR
jgi:2-polyprenyl-3-methyl-5-hydroxy-6-metoxy-1,4-benzoquinol methylase